MTTAHPSSSGPARVLRLGRFTLDLSTPRVMGVVNVTPDSFSDGGRHFDTRAAIAHAERLIAEGADIVDIGAESTRPRAATIPEDDEWARLAPILAALRDAPVPVSADTRKPGVMRRALDAGAAMINDVGGFASAEAVAVVATSDCAVCAMHMQGDPATMQDAPRYDAPGGVVAEVAAFLAARATALEAAGVAGDRIVVDPGFGFGKTLDHNLALLRATAALASLGWPLLVGLSRKGTIGALTGRPVDRRMAGSVAAALVSVERGAAIVRVHDVAETVDALKVWCAVRHVRGIAADARGRADAGPTR